jgi:hypothetical protein
MLISEIREQIAARQQEIKTLHALIDQTVIDIKTKFLDDLKEEITVTTYKVRNLTRRRGTSFATSYAAYSFDVFAMLNLEEAKQKVVPTKLLKRARGKQRFLWNTNSHVLSDVEGKTYKVICKFKMRHWDDTTKANKTEQFYYLLCPDSMAKNRFIIYSEPLA